MTDEYDRSAEYIDVLLAGPWQRYGPAVAEVLHGAHGPVVDLGSGTGRALDVIADAVPDTEIFAVEPSAAMRTALMVKIAGDERLARRVTVLADDIGTVELPDRIGAVVAMNVIGHFDPPSRRELWSMLAARLGHGAPVVLNLSPPYTPEVVPESSLGRVSVGRRTYVGLGSAEPAEDPEQLVWHMTYRTLDGDVIVAEERVDYAWWLLTPDELRLEAGHLGLSTAPVGDPALGLYVVRR